ncbi:MAG TPA: hypothetical protein VGX28_11390 [Frankiaceae bacterium]|jgi:hypothetical protein|nr:hypothetical protein [Frankiaceae bacterium]
MTETNVPASGAEPEVGAEVPEADAVEQAQGEAVDMTPGTVRSIPDDVPVADALEQAYEVDLEDDY